MALTLPGELSGSPTDPLRQLAGGLSASMGGMDSERRHTVALETIVHVAEAEGGVMLDTSGTVLASIGLAWEDVDELAAVASAWIPVGQSRQVHLPSTSVDAVPLPVRLGGGDSATVVLTTDCGNPFGIDLSQVSLLLDTLSQEPSPPR